MNFDDVVLGLRGPSTGITHLATSYEGGVVEEWYRSPRLRTTPHMLHSATKSFVSTAAGMAVADGLLDIDAPMIDYLPAAYRERAEGLARTIRVSDLLTMRTGHPRGSSGVAWRRLTGSWIAEYLSEEIASDPGHEFMYSSGTSHMLSACVQGAVGAPVDEFLTGRLFEPLGIREWSWSRDPEGISSGGNGLSLLTTDLLKWGQLYLNGGTWNGQALVDPAWIEASTSRQVDVGSLAWDGSGYSISPTAKDDGSGYGYQIWLKDGAFYASGMFGQACIVVPDARAVVAVNSALPRSQSDTLVSDLIASARSRAAELAAQPDVRESVYGTYRDAEGRYALTVERTEAGVRISGSDAWGPVEAVAGLEGPVVTVGPMIPPELHHSYTADETPISALAEHVSPGTLRVTVDYLGSPFVDTLELSLDAAADSATFSRRTNVNSGATEGDSVTLNRVAAVRA